MNTKKLSLMMFISGMLLFGCGELSDNGIKTVVVPNPLTNPLDGPAAGNVTGNYPVPVDGGLADISKPTQIIGNGTAESVTSDAVVKAVAKGGIITFNTGGKPVTVMLDNTAKVFNDSSSDIVIDGGGLVTLSGCGARRILYMNTCDQNQHWTTTRCDDQATPRLTVQNLTFIDGNSSGEAEHDGGGAIWIRGGRFKAVNCRFFNNVSTTLGPDIGGGAIRVFDQYQDLPVYLVNCTFGGADGYGNIAANGGAISSIGVSWSIYNCVFSYNKAIGNGGNPKEANTPGGGSGGAIYNDGNTMTLAIYGSKFEYNKVNAYGAAIFFVTNNLSGNIHIENTTSRNNIGGSWHILPGIAMHDVTKRTIINSVLE